MDRPLPIAYMEHRFIWLSNNHQHLLVMKNILFTTSILTLLAIIACKGKMPATVEAALKDAGNNRRELQKVLEHYSAPADTLKLKAAKFLIANMPYHYGYYGSEMEKHGIIFSIIDTLSYRKENVTVEDKMHIGDSLLTIYDEPRQDGVKAIPDTKVVSADYLITNIDFAFRAWQQAPWRKR